MEEMDLDAKNEQSDALIKALRAKITELDAVIAHLPGHVYWFNQEGFFLGCNQNQAEFLQLPSREAIIGKRMSDIAPIELAKMTDRINFHVMTKQAPFIGEELCDIPGRESIYLSQKVPLLTRDGDAIGVLGVSLDITDRKRVEQELKDAKLQADFANSIKNEFIRNMEHDIRTPLCGIMSIVSHLSTIEQDKPKKEFLNDLHIVTNELLNYLDNIVEFSQLNTGAVPFVTKEFNLEHMIVSILKLELAAAKHKEIDLIISYPESVPKLVIGDRFRLHRILLNLVNNAVKFTRKGCVKISVQMIKQLKEDEVLLEIAVEDTGIGIDKKNHQKIYEKFHRCDPSNKGLYKGTGLGLWVVHQYVNDLKGEVSLKSEFGKGSVFACHVPFRLSLASFNDRK
jgi:two-component system aerobic respiration control sensor histidine kinase ArcB